MSGAAGGPATGRRNARTTLIGLGLLGLLSVLAWWLPGWDDRLQSAWFDSYQRMHPRELASTPVAVVEIDEESLARLGQWPWPRTRLAELIAAIASHDPMAIGIDILMPEADRLSPERLLADIRQRDPVLASRLDALPSSDSQLARAIADAPVVLPIAGTPYAGADEPIAPPFVVVDRARGEANDIGGAIPRFAGARVNLPELERAAAGHGAISAKPGETVVRRMPLVVRIADRLVPSLATEMLRVAFSSPDIRLYATGPRVDTIAIGDVVLPTEEDGQMRLYYSHRDAHRQLSAIRVLDGAVDPVSLQRKLVIVSVTGLALVDYQLTPLGERMPGAEVHAQLLENVVDQSWLTRPLWARWIELGVLVCAGLALVWATPRWKPGASASLTLAFVALILVAGIMAFTAARLLLDAATPALALLVLFGALLVPTLAEDARERRALERMVQLQREQAAYVAGELEAAKRIQLGFLPRPDALAHDPRVEIAASMTPAREVGGDLYDFFRLDAGRLFFLVGDVSGKGLSASLFMAVGKALCKSITLRSAQAPIGDVMCAANAELSRDNPELLFVTAFAGILDLDSGTLAYCNAGHDDPYVLRKGTGVETRLAEGAGPPLCSLDAFPYAGAEQRMQPGDVLCVVTDGVFDAQNPAGERYGTARLDALLARCALCASPHDVVDSICADVRAFAAGAEPADDLTVLALRWNGPVGASTSR